MATLSWITGTSGLWTTAANWSSDTVPGAGDTAVVNVPGNYLVDVLGNIGVGNVILDASGAGIEVGGSFSITGGLTIATGEVSVTGSLGAATLVNGGVVDNSSTLNVGTLSNVGSIENSGTLGVDTLNNTGSIDNSGVLLLNGSITSAQLGQVGGSGITNIIGTLNNAGDTLGESSQAIQDFGLIQGGTIGNAVIEGGSTIYGVTAVGVLHSFGSVVVLDGLFGPTGGATGTLALGGTLNFANIETVSNVSLTGSGTIDTDSTLTVNGSVLAIGSVAGVDSFDANANSVFDGTGTVIFNGSMQARSTDGFDNQISGAGHALITVQNADFENFGVLSATDSSAPANVGVGNTLHQVPTSAGLVINGGVFVNHAGGIIETGQSSGVGFITVSAATSFTNDGTLSTMGPDAIQGGTIDIEGFVQGSGTIEINGGGAVTLGFANPTQTVDFLDGGGTLTFSSANGAGAAIEGFKDGDAIVLDGVSATPISFTSGDLKLQTGFGPLNFGVTGSYSVDDFVATYNGTDTVIQLGASQTLRHLDPGTIGTVDDGGRLVIRSSPRPQQRRLDRRARNVTRSPRQARSPCLG